MNRDKGEPDRRSRRCLVCGDDEPFHVHHQGRRIEGYFTVGRGQSNFDAARAWKARAVELEREREMLAEAVIRHARHDRTCEDYPLSGGCTCGLRAILLRLQEGEGRGQASEGGKA